MIVKVCVGSRCTMMGSSAMLDALENLQKRYFRDGGLEIVHLNCLNVCKEKGLDHAKPQVISEMILSRAGKLSE